MKLNRKNYLESKKLLEDFDAHVKGFLEKLEDAERAMIEPYRDIMAGVYYSVYHNRPFLYFYRFNDNNYRPIKIRGRSPFNYEVVASTDQYVTVKVLDCNFDIPFDSENFNFDLYFKNLYCEIIAQLNKLVKLKEKDIEEEKQRKEEAEDIRRTRKSNGHEYFWKKCPRCLTGKIAVGTGKYRDSQYYDGQEEIKEDITCPKCNGTCGLLVVDEKERPCNEWTFKRLKNDLFELLNEIM